MLNSRMDFPHEYLSEVLARLPFIKITGTLELLPGQWEPHSANTS